ncbi:hypothetical protein GCM10010982_27540 [Bowmanella pacifica]|uniref:Uncharacterized protein n=1 Tax=Bowmanella pacifica TaxID=502051 RepID=A0A917Z2V1_9ALTE|nr:hypothetical protein GCM10010982_27540 [Bowmanella pacifica]
MGVFNSEKLGKHKSHEGLHWFDDSNENNHFGYMSKSDKEKGKSVGTHLEGW